MNLEKEQTPTDHTVETMRSFCRILPVFLLPVWLPIWIPPDPGLAGEPDTAAFSVAAVLVHKQAFDRPHDVELQGDLAFVPGKGGSLAIVNVSDPTKPRLAQKAHRLL